MRPGACDPREGGRSSLGILPLLGWPQPRGRSTCRWRGRLALPFCVRALALNFPGEPSVPLGPGDSQETLSTGRMELGTLGLSEGRPQS